MATVRFDHVSKSFPRHVGRMLLRQRVMNWFRGGDRERFFALTDVSFSVDAGQSLGIVGGNGAGKSTTLNLITHLCRPSSGKVEVNGRVAALLELGSGFHPDLTGAENVRTNAALLGLTRKQTAESFGAIVDFADIGDFIDEPLRTYSAGMMMRLAFAVAIHVDPDILVIDEVIGVGDHAFFEKCVRRIEDFRRRNKTIICVSHALPMVAALCDRALWLDHGRVVKFGSAPEVLREYSTHSGASLEVVAG